MMLVCPACANPLSPSLMCVACDWRGKYRDGVPVLLRDSDETDAAMRSYTENYDRIARDDLDAKVMDERYVENLADNFCRLIPHVSGSDICDIGSGKGFLVRKLLARGAASVTAVDISSPYLVRLTGKPGVLPILANAEALPFVEHFDIIVATDVLEHVLNVGSFLYSVNRALRPNGCFYVRVPYRENLLPYSPHLGCSYQFVHLRTYDRPLLRQALREAGFAVERLWHDGYVPELARGLWRRNWVGQELHRRFQQRLRSRGRDTADVTRLPHGLRRILLQPTVVIAAGRKINKLAPMGGGGFAPRLIEHRARRQIPQFSLARRQSRLPGG